MTQRCLLESGPVSLTIKSSTGGCVSPAGHCDLVNFTNHRRCDFYLPSHIISPVIAVCGHSRCTAVVAIADKIPSTDVERLTTSALCMHACTPAACGAYLGVSSVTVRVGTDV